MNFSQLKKKYKKISLNDLIELLNHFFQISQNSIYLDEELDLNIEFLDPLINKVQDGYPVSYVTSTAKFLSRDFYVDERVLIPRPETEELVKYTISRLNKSEEYKILDICTGSGVIGISIAEECANTLVTLSDISIEALEVAQENRLFFASKNIERLILSDCFEAIFDKFDIIVGNPPYIKIDEDVDKSVLDYEPHLALYGGITGVEIFEKIFASLHNVISENFQFAIFEISPLIVENLNALQKKYLSDFSFEYLRDINDKIRFLVISA